MQGSLLIFLRKLKFGFRHFVFILQLFPIATCKRGFKQYSQKSLVNLYCNI